MSTRYLLGPHCMHKHCHNLHDDYFCLISCIVSHVRCNCRPHSYDYSAFSSKYEKLQARRAAMFRRSADTVLMEDSAGTSVEYSVTYVGYDNQKTYVDLSQLTDNINTAASSTGSSGLCSQMSATGAQSCTSSLVTMSAVVATAAPTTGPIILRRNTNDSSDDDSGIIGLVIGCVVGVIVLVALLYLICANPPSYEELYVKKRTTGR